MTIILCSPSISTTTIILLVYEILLAEGLFVITFNIVFGIYNRCLSIMHVHNNIMLFFCSSTFLSEYWLGNHTLTNVPYRYYRLHCHCFHYLKCMMPKGKLIAM